MAIGNFAGLAGYTPSGAQTTSAPRVAMTLTSRLRRAAVAGATLLADGATEATIGARQFDALAFFGNLNSFMPTIAMAVNPKSIKWVQPKRFTKKDTREGSVFFHFTNSKGQNQDILTLQFQGNTGNIDLRGTFGDPNQPPSLSQQEVTNATSGRGAGQDTGALYKLLVWHNLYLMSREPMLLGDGTENIVTMVYSSALFPSEIAFDGFFTKPLEFEEAGDKPNSRNYSFDFIVQRSDPDLDMALQGLSDILRAPPTTPVFSNPTDGGVFIPVEARLARDPLTGETGFGTPTHVSETLVLGDEEV